MHNQGLCRLIWTLRLAKDELEDMDVSLYFQTRHKGPITFNLNISKTIYAVTWIVLFSENLGYLWPLEVGFMCLRQFVFEWEHFEKKFSKILFPAQRKNWHFVKNIKNYLILTKNCDQTTWPTINHKVSLERQCPYLSSGTFGFEICPPIRSQLPCENQGPLTSSRKIEWYVHIL